MADTKRNRNKSNVKNKINNALDKINIKNLYNPHNLEEAAKRVFEIDRQNMELLKGLNIVHRTKGRIDCWRRQFIDDNFLQMRKKNNERISQENAELYGRLKATVGEFSMSKKEPNWNAKAKVATRKSKKKQAKPTSVAKAIHAPFTRCFLELEVVETGEKLGKLIIQLYEIVVPKTCENFAALCVRSEGRSYRGTPFHRIISGYLCQGGDITNRNGTGGQSIWGEDFADENFKLRHSCPGILSMLNHGKDTNNSLFNITFKRLQPLDGHNVVFGRVIQGLANIYKIEALGTVLGRPRKTVIISNCGVC